MATFPAPTNQPSPLSPLVPLNSPMVGFASPFDHADGQNRDLILEAIRTWASNNLLTWSSAWQLFFTGWIANVDAYLTSNATPGFSWRTTVTPIAAVGTTNVVIDPGANPLRLGDLVVDQSVNSNYGIVTALIDLTDATVTYVGYLHGAPGPTTIPTDNAVAGLVNSTTSATNAALARNVRIRPEDYGAVGGAKSDLTGVATATSSTLTTTNAVFSAADVGKIIAVYGAGAAGAILITTITVYTSPTVVTLAVAANTTTTASLIIWGRDDTAALQAAVTAAQTARGSLEITRSHITSATLVTTQSFYQPNIYGTNAKGNIIYGIGAFSILKLVGGSGALAVTKISNLGFTGPGCVGVELSACDGVIPENCWFGRLTGGVLFNNAAAGSFTEFCVADSCDFESTVTTAIEYRVGAGNNSFHGTGFRNCVFSQPTAATAPVILIGAGALVYGAPWSGNFFQNSTTPLTRNNSSRAAMTQGVINVEGNASAALLDPASVSKIYHQGDVYQFGSGLTIGTNFIVCERVQVNPDTSIEFIMKKQATLVNAATGTTPITMPLARGDYLINVFIAGANYTFDYLLSVHRSQSNNGGTVTVLSNGEAFNAAAWGAPTFAVNSTNSTVDMTNATTGFSVTAAVTVTTIGSVSNLLK